MKWKPLHDRIIAERIATPDKTPGGIVLPDNAKSKPQRGMVIACGPGRILESGTLVPLTVKVGDEILFSHYSGHEIEGETRESPLLFLSEVDVLAIVEK